MELQAAHEPLDGLHLLHGGENNIIKHWEALGNSPVSRQPLMKLTLSCSYKEPCQKKGNNLASQSFQSTIGWTEQHRPKRPRLVRLVLTRRPFLLFSRICCPRLSSSSWWTCRYDLTTTASTHIQFLFHPLSSREAPSTRRTNANRG